MLAERSRMAWIRSGGDIVRTRSVLLPVIAASMAAVATVPAAVLDTGDDPSQPPALAASGGEPSPCRVAWFREEPFESPDIDRLRSLGHDVTRIVASQLALASLLDFDALVIAYTGTGLIAEYRDDIQAFVESGHGLLVHQPNHVGALDYCPIGFNVDILGTLWCDAGFAVRIEQPAHPLVAGLTEDDLSGAFDTVGALGPAWTVLATNAGCGDPALAAGVAGAGRLLFETGNAGAQSLAPGSPTYWSAVLSFLCANGPVGTRAASFAAVKGSYR